MTFAIPPRGIFVRIADAVMTPIMYLLAGTLRESPQRTHRWNNKRLSAEERALLDQALLYVLKGDPSMPRRILLGFIPFFHMPILGGHREYVVFMPCDTAVHKWHIGWDLPEVCGVSRFAFRGPQRVLGVPHDVKFFGIDAQTGKQIQLQLIGKGSVGNHDPYAHVPLL